MPLPRASSARTRNRHWPSTPASVTLDRVTEPESFPASLRHLPGVRADWCERVDGIDVDCDRDEAMRRLRPHHERHLAASGSTGGALWRGEQVHGNRVAMVPGPPTTLAADGLPVVPGVDGLLTATRGVTLAIYVADCAPLWLADPAAGVAGLLHSGKKGTEGDILGVAVEIMRREFRSDPANIVLVIGPCIRPPDYEVDIAATIRAQAAAHGIGTPLDCGLNTATHPDRFYSYRRELGKTGRMMATIRIDQP